METSYTNWMSGQPNNYDGDQDCVAKQCKDECKWNDAACSDNNYAHALCQREK